MAHLMKLPFELFCEVLSLVQLEDLENCAATCREIQALSKPYLAEHRKTIHRFSRVTDVGEVKGQSRLIDTLREVLNRPRIGSYIRAVKVKHLSKKDTTERRLDAADFALFEEAAQKSQAFINIASAHTPAIDWMEEMSHCNERPIFNFTVTALAESHEIVPAW